MVRRCLAYAAVVICSSVPLQSVEAEPRAVIELFTSQGCSSCPPADQLLGELTSDSSLIAVSVPVDYWDYLGWKDTLAVAGHSKRQKAYSHARGDREVYTPQVVVNGAVQTLGSDQAAIERAIAQSRRNAATLSQPLTLAVANGRVTVAASAARSDASKNDASAEVWLCPVSKMVEVAIGRGENSGHTITYHNVVRRWVKLGVWKGNAESWSIPLDDVKTEGVDAVVVILQSGTAAVPGAMLGAAMTSLDATKTASPLNPAIRP